jgi:coniferyl-aldehyde dehydrogenase
MNTQLQTTFQSLHAASRQTALTIPQRQSHLKAITRSLKQNMDAWCAAIDADFAGRHPDETKLLEIAPSVQGLRHTLSHLSSWAKPRRASTSVNFFPASNKIIPQALGVIGIVVPWNYPLYLTLAPLATAIAAGNRVMIKMSEHTPRTAALMAKTLHECLPADVCQVVEGDVEIAKAFCALPFDHLLFTGATQLGASVLHAAADNLTPVTLELGGKSPAIVGKDADIQNAARRIAVGKWRHAGQTCIAPDYVLVEQSQHDALVKALTQQASKMYPDAINNSAYSSIINIRQFERLSRMAEEAQAGGAVLQGYSASLQPKSQAMSHRIAPTVVTNAPMASKLMQDEIFGPLLPIISYKTQDEAIAFINARPRPLALYVFDQNKANIDQVMDQTVAGGVSVNDTIFHIAQESLPFGGVGASGMGHYHGQWGFDTFSKLKPVFTQSRFNLLGLLDPPHGKMFYRVLAKLIGK